MTTIVELDCGCTGRTQHTVHVGDDLVCETHGDTAAARTEYFTNLPKAQKRGLPLLGRRGTDGDVLKRTEVYESEQPRVEQKPVEVVVPQKEPVRVIANPYEDLRTVDVSFHEARREQARTIRSLQNQEKRLQASLEATEEQLAVLANRLSQASGESPKKIIDETLKHRNLRRRALLDDMNLFWADGD